LAVLKIFKKTKVPDELPDLVTDEIEKKIIEEAPRSTVQETSIKENTKEDENKEIKIEETGEIIESAPKENKEPEKKVEKSFFLDLQKNINHEINDLNDLEKWYNSKFLSRDVVSDMKNYWEKQKSGSIIKVLGKNFQERISEKTKKLQELEKDWQNIYFDLIEKEEEIREEEAQLKKMLSEFVGFCRIKEKELKKGKKIKKRIKKINLKLTPKKIKTGQKKKGKKK
jgi:hypothetical protein